MSDPPTCERSGSTAASWEIAAASAAWWSCCASAEVDGDATLLREDQGIESAKETIAPGSVVSADEVTHWDGLEPDFDMRRINHSEAYSRDGAHTNLAESYFSRLRRMIGGQHLKVEGRYLDAYAAHAAWLEDHRSDSNGHLADRLIGGALAGPASRSWKGYWQRCAA